MNDYKDTNVEAIDIKKKEKEKAEKIVRDYLKPVSYTHLTLPTNRCV